MLPKLEARSIADTTVSRLGPVSSPRLALLGGFDVTADGVSVPLPMSARRLVAFMALRDRPMLRVYVAGTLWPETTDRQAAANLRSAIWRLGRPGYALIDIGAGQIELARNINVDVRESVALAHRLLDRSPTVVEYEHGEAELGERSLSKDLLPDWYDEWVLIEQERFRQLRLHALEALCDRLIVMGKYPEAIQAGLSAVAAEPLRETATRLLVRAHLAEGNPGEAIRRYRVFRALLNEELALEPTKAMQDMVRDLPLLTLG